MRSAGARNPGFTRLLLTPAPLGGATEHENERCTRNGRMAPQSPPPIHSLLKLLVDIKDDGAE